MEFHLWKSNPKLIIALPKQHYNNPSHTRQPSPIWANACGDRDVQPWMGLVGHTASPYKPLGLLARPLSHRQKTFCLSTKSWGQIDIFLKPLGLQAPNNLRPPKLPSVVYISHNHHSISSIFHLNVDGQLICFICAYYEKVMYVQTSAVLEPFPGHCYFRTLSRDNAPLKWSYLLAQTPDRGVLEHSKILMP